MTYDSNVKWTSIVLVSVRMLFVVIMMMMTEKNDSFQHPTFIPLSRSYTTRLYHPNTFSSSSCISYASLVSSFQTTPTDESSIGTTTTSSSSSTSLPTLTSDTTWMIRITIQKSISTTTGGAGNGKSVVTTTPLSDPILFVVYGQFLPTENYEPPQGIFVQQQDTNVDTTTSSSSNSNNIQLTNKSRWILSEDPNDRKDGLWIWGLFQQPLYPYMLFNIETKPYTSTTTASASSSNNNNGITLPALQLYVQLNHKCDRTTGAVSFTTTTTGANNQRDNYPLMIRQVETIAADPLQLSKVDIYEEIVIGTISIQPVV